MNLGDKDQLALWLVHFGGNVVTGVAAITLYAGIRARFEGENRQRDSILIGLVFGLAALLAMRLTITISPGVIVDTRNVFLVVGGLFGGPISAAIAGAMALVYRAELGGVGMPQGMVSIVIACLLGTGVSWRFGPRIRSFGIRELGLIGFVEALLSVAWRHTYYSVIVDRATLPLSGDIALIVIFTLSALALGAVMSITHYRQWWRAQTRLSDILNVSSDIVWETDVNENMTYVSERYRSILGHAPQEMIGKPPNALGGHWDSDADRQTYLEALRARKPYDGLVYHMTAKDGAPKIIQMHGWPLFDPSQRFVGYRGIARDITDRENALTALKQRDEQLRLSREHFALAQQIGHMGSIEVEIASSNGVWSDQMFRLLGLPRDGAETLEHFLTAIHPEDRAGIMADHHALKHGEVPPPREYRIVRPDGELRWLHRQVELIHDATGKPVRHISTFVDVTDRMTIEAALRTGEAELVGSREHLARAQAIAKVGSAEIDLVTNEDRWSDELYRLIGIEPQSVPPLFENFLPFVHPDDREHMARIRATTEQGNLVEPDSFRVIRPNGDIRWVHRQSDQVHNARGETIRIVVSLQDITDRKQAELELQRREDQLQLNREHLALAQNVGKIGSSEIDFVAKTMWWSEQLYALFGLDPAIPPSFEVFLSVLLPEDQALAHRLRVQEQQGIPSPPREVQVVRPDGERRWLYRQVGMVTGEGGKPRGMITTYQDVTDRRRMEEALQMGREHLARAQRIGRIGSAEVDLASKRVYWSDGMFELLGLEPANTAPGGEAFMALVHPEDRSLVVAHRVAALRGTGAAPIEFRIIRPDGETRWIYHKVETVFGVDGSPQKLIGIDQDITDLKRAVLELGERDDQFRDSQRHLALAQRVGRIGSVQINTNTGDSRWSDEMFTLLGLERGVASAGEMTLLSVIHPDDRLMMRQRRERLARGEKNASIEFRIIRPDTGELRWIQAQWGPGGDAEAPDIAIGTFQDITDLKTAQSQRAEAERQLMQAQKMEAVGNLTGGIAHDFNNLLNVILGRLDLIDGELADRPALREWVQICAAAARKGASLTRSMMAFARQQPLRPQPIDLAASVGETVGLLQRTLGAAIEIKVVCADNLWICEADPAQIQSALLNLALNARDAMPEGGKLTIDVHNKQIDEAYVAQNADVVPGDYVVLAVTDTGTGMSAGVIEHAFEPFFTTKEVGKGSGLGLSMVYGFARQSGGHAKIYSEVGEGTTVRVYLPRLRNVQSRVAEAVTKPQPAAMAKAIGRETILVVEDDADMRSLAVAVLSRLEYSVLSARDAESAQPIFAAHPEIDLLLTDISLPGAMNGRRLADHLLTIRPALKVLYMSGYSEDAIIHQGRLDPGVRLLQKPFQNDELASQIRAVLNEA